jgi:hypothetical protein
MVDQNGFNYLGCSQLELHFCVIPLGLTFRILRLLGFLSCFGVLTLFSVNVHESVCTI